MDAVMLELSEADGPMVEPLEADRRGAPREGVQGPHRRLEDVIVWLHRSVAGPDWHLGVRA